MKAFGIFLGIIAGLALLAALLAGGYFLFRYLASVYGTLEPQMKTIAAIASVVAVLCAAIVSGGLKARYTSESEIAQKTNVYERLTVLWANRLKTGVEAVADESELIRHGQLLALHGSPKVIGAYMELRRCATESGKEGGEVLGLLNKLVLAMRTDLGRRELNVKEKDVLDLLLGRS